mmetsp:Transcript_18058/g.49197  ORF Transcript_18058/g.49197 Transcript_18058/m.49197 type:complete len:305 (+) Transcript_18058:132-1046(+)
MNENELREEYQLSNHQWDIFKDLQAKRNMPDFLSKLSNEEWIWNIAVETFGLSNRPTPSDLRFFQGKAEERLKRLEEGERRYKWLTLKWNKPQMQRLIRQWYCGMLVIDPNLVTRDGNPIQFVREYYGEDSGYPLPADQSDEWKQDSMDSYVLLARSICLSYPMATSKGIVSVSDMQNFDWNKYDMGTKERNANISSYIPNKLTRMIAFHPDDKMKDFYNDMLPAVRKKYGFVQYESFADMVEGEGDFLPGNLPTFVGGTYTVDILACLQHLFRREPDVLKLLEETYAEMEHAGDLPHPSHMPQ